MVCYNQAIAIAKECGLEPGEVTEVKINSRFTRALGRCTVNRRTGTYILQFQKDMVDNCGYNFIMQTILHEIIHTCPDCWNHGKTFKANARKIMDRYPQYNIRTTNDPETECGVDLNAVRYNKSTAAKYIFRCNKCGKILYKSRMCGIVRHPECYGHKGCDGRFERIK